MESIIDFVEVNANAENNPFISSSESGSNKWGVDGDGDQCAEVELDWPVVGGKTKAGVGHDFDEESIDDGEQLRDAVGVTRKFTTWPFPKKYIPFTIAYGTSLTSLI